MKYNLPERVIRDISTFAKKHSVEKVILFGSRARGTNTERSDIDIAVYGGDFDSFYWDIKEKVHSLLMFDVVEIDAGISEEARAGLLLYELCPLCLFLGQDGTAGRQPLPSHQSGRCQQRDADHHRRTQRPARSCHGPGPAAVG